MRASRPPDSRGIPSKQAMNSRSILLSFPKQYNSALVDSPRCKTHAQCRNKCAGVCKHLLSTYGPGAVAGVAGRVSTGSRLRRAAPPAAGVDPRGPWRGTEAGSAHGASRWGLIRSWPAQAFFGPDLAGACDRVVLCTSAVQWRAGWLPHLRSALLSGPKELQEHITGLLEACKADAQDGRVETRLGKPGGSGQWFRNAAPQRASQRGCWHRNRSGPRPRARPPVVSVSPRRSRPSRSSPRGA